MNEYRADEAEALDAFQRIGAAAGFFAFEFAPDLPELPMKSYTRT